MKLARSSLAPIALMIGAKLPYSVVQKVLPQDVDPFSSLVLTYSVCALFALSLWILTRKGRPFSQELAHLNWGVPVLGACLVMMDLATMAMFRAGWDLSVGMLVLFVLLGIVLAGVGALFYGEKVSPKRIGGLIFSCAGVILVTL